MVVATVNLEDVRSKRANFIARSFQASSAPKIPRLSAAISLSPVQGRAPERSIWTIQSTSVAPMAPSLAATSMTCPDSWRSSEASW